MKIHKWWALLAWFRKGVPFKLKLMCHVLRGKPVIYRVSFTKTVGLAGGECLVVECKFAGDVNGLELQGGVEGPSDYFEQNK